MTFRVTARCVRAPEAGAFTIGFVYPAEAVFEHRKVVWIVRDSEGTLLDVPEADFTTQFLVVDQAAGFRRPYDDDQLWALVEPKLAAATAAYREELARSHDDHAALLTAVTRAGTLLRDDDEGDVMLTDDEWERLGERLVEYRFTSHADEHQAASVVRTLIKTRAPAQALMEWDDRPVCVGRADGVVFLDFGRKGCDGRCSLDEHARGLVRDLATGCKVFLRDGDAIWAIRREADAFLLERRGTDLRGRVDARVLTEVL